MTHPLTRSILNVLKKGYNNIYNVFVRLCQEKNMINIPKMMCTIPIAIMYFIYLNFIVLKRYSEHIRELTVFVI